MSGVVLVSAPHVALISTVLLPVSLSVLGELEPPLQPVTLLNTSTINSRSGKIACPSFALLLRMFAISRRGIGSRSHPRPLLTAKDEVVGAVPVMVKLVVAVAPFVSVSVEGLKVHVIPTGSPVQA